MLHDHQKPPIYIRQINFKNVIPSGIVFQSANTYSDIFLIAGDNLSTFCLKTKKKKQHYPGICHLQRKSLDEVKQQFLNFSLLLI